jgi:hypothetical protein
MRNFNIMTLVLATAFAFSSASYAQDEKEKSGWQTAKDVAKKGVEVGGKVGGKMVEGQSLSDAIDNTTKEEIPVYAFLSSHQGVQCVIGKTWGGPVFLCAFIIIFILIVDKKRGGWLLLIAGGIVSYLALRAVVFGIEYMDGDGPKIMGFIALATLLVEIAISHKFFRALPVAFSDDGFKGIIEVCKTDFSNPSATPTPSDDNEGEEFSECPSCHKKLMLEGSCGFCGHTIEVPDVPDAPPPAVAGSTTATTSTPAATPRPRTRVERREARKNRRF